MTSGDARGNPEDGLILAAPKADGEGALPHVVLLGQEGEEAEGKPARRWNKRLGIAGSLLVHGLVLYFLFAGLDRPLPPVTMLTILPVEVVIGQETASPQQERQAAAPQRRSAAPIPVAPRAAPQSTQKLASLAPPPVVVPLPPPPAPPRDAMQDRLEALSRLRAPETGNSDANAAGNGTRRGPQAYSVKDYVRAQIERRWSLNVEALRNRNIVVAVHVVLERDGTVMVAEIVDQKRFQNDRAYYEVALSARAAVVLSSPVALPGGGSDEDLDMVLNLSPRDVLR